MVEVSPKAKSKLKLCSSIYLVKSTFYFISLTITEEVPQISIISGSLLAFSFYDNGLFLIHTEILGALLANSKGALLKFYYIIFIFCF